MVNLSFAWVFIGLATVVDVVGLFYLSRRCNSTVGTGHRHPRLAAHRVRPPTADRRRGDRRGQGRAASA
jgi:hypothetical protein